MAPPTPGRHRGPRPQVNNNIGEAGRTTNIVPPKHVPRDSAGHERAEDFFDRAVNGAEEEDDYEDDEPAPVVKAKPSAKKKSVVNGAAREKRGERPDRFMLGEDRGRKTGVVKAPSQRDAEGFEDIDNFFKSPSPSRSVATAKSTVKSRKSLFNPPSPGLDEDDYDDDGSDMALDDGTSLSPTAYQRNHPSSARQPSSLRHSTLPSGSHSHSRKGLATSSPNSPRRSVTTNGTSGRRRLSSLSGSGDEAADDRQYASSDEEDEDEVVRAALAPSSKKADKGKGRASRASRVEDDEEEQDDVEMNGHDYGDDEDDYGAAEPSPPPTARKTSAKKKPAAPRASNASSAASPITSGLMKLDRNGKPVPVADRKGKGKAVERSPSPEQDDNIYQDDFGGGYSDDGGEGEGSPVDGEGFPQYDVGDYDDSEEEDPDAPGPSSQPAKASKKSSAGAKKGKAAPAKKGRRATSESDSPEPRKSHSAPQRRRKLEHSQEPVVTQIPRKRDREDGTVDIDGVRRSTRQRLEPLAYWRNERVVYKRRASGVGMNAIIRVPTEEPAPLTKAGKKRGQKPSSTAASSSKKPRSRTTHVKNEPNPEDGCDDMTDPDGVVWSWEGNAETTRRIAFTAKMIDPKPTFDNKYSFQKIYQELDYLAGGIMVIPPGGKKAKKPSKDNSYVFYCIQGSVSVTIHRTRFSIGPGGTFLIPRGNHYEIVATSEREVRLFFAQGRRVIEYPNGETEADQRPRLDAVPEEDEEEGEGSEEEEEEEEEEK
ncbi:hypothetical protein JCM8097_008743 [Rhodosporidiobolus ruineniae]